MEVCRDPPSRPGDTRVWHRARRHGGSQSHDLPTGRYLLTVSLQGYPVVNRFSGRLEGDVIRRTVEVSGGNSQPLRREWEARRVK